MAKNITTGARERGFAPVMDLRERVPLMPDEALQSLHQNALRLVKEGTAKQQRAASDLLPVVEAEMDLRRKTSGRDYRVPGADEDVSEIPASVGKALCEAFDRLNQRLGALESATATLANHLEGLKRNG